MQRNSPLQISHSIRQLSSTIPVVSRLHPGTSFHCILQAPDACAPLQISPETLHVGGIVFSHTMNYSSLLIYKMCIIIYNIYIHNKHLVTWKILCNSILTIASTYCFGVSSIASSLVSIPNNNRIGQIGASFWVVAPGATCMIRNRQF